MGNDDLWTAPLNGELEWRLVDEALAARLPEGPRIEYRERFDPSAGAGSARRFVDTVAAMANSGGGHILFGVHTTSPTAGRRSRRPSAPRHAPRCCPELPRTPRAARDRHRSQGQ